MCVRIDSYESEEHQEYVRTFLEGRFENSAFCLLTPDGQDWLTRAGRGPQMVIGRSASESVRKMNQIAAVYASDADRSQALVPDFHTVRQALNVASADQRILALIYGTMEETAALKDSFRSVASDAKVIGRFHFDFESDGNWTRVVEGANEESPAGVYLVNPGEFGMDGRVMGRLPLDAENSDLVAALVSANSEFAKTTEKKVYSAHVSKGRDLGIYFEGAVPYGEDRDGDGQVDRGRSRGSNSRSSSRGRSRRPAR